MISRPGSPERAAEVSSGRELPPMQRYAYGVGHMFNDLSAACWFSYLLVYLHSVAQLSNETAGEPRARAPRFTQAPPPPAPPHRHRRADPPASLLRTGNIYLLGHVVDALCTPIVGIASDNTKSKYGRRKYWHLIGSIAGLLSFPFILSDP